MNVEFCEDSSGTSKKMPYFRKILKVGARGKFNFIVKTLSCSWRLKINFYNNCIYSSGGGGGGGGVIFFSRGGLCDMFSFSIGISKMHVIIASLKNSLINAQFSQLKL